MATPKAKLGLALSGAAARSMFYVGFLEVLKEEQIEIEVIAAQSGAAFVAASFVCGTLHKLKADLFALNWDTIRELMQASHRGGIYTLEGVEQYVRNNYTLGQHFSHVSPKICFTATDLSTGDLVPLAIGDIARSVHTTCAIPGIFEPVHWGNHLLADGGIVSVVPGRLAREYGADVVIGLELLASRHVFLGSLLKVRSWWNSLVRLTGFATEPRSTNFYVTSTSTFEHEEEEGQIGHGVLKILGRSMDLALEARRLTSEHQTFGCNLLIREGENKFGDSFKLGNMQQLYENGRACAVRYLPTIRHALDNYSTSSQESKIVKF